MQTSYTVTIMSILSFFGDDAVQTWKHVRHKMYRWSNDNWVKKNFYKLFIKIELQFEFFLFFFLSVISSIFRSLCAACYKDIVYPKSEMPTTSKYTMDSILRTAICKASTQSLAGHICSEECYKAFGQFLLEIVTNNIIQCKKRFDT